MPRTFAVTFDYLCPFARNANEHVVTALRAGADWNVEFVPFSLAQVHVEEDEPAVWDRAGQAAEPSTMASGVLALQAGLAVRDQLPEQFLDAHLSLFAARHDDGEDIGDPAVVRNALKRAGADHDAVFEEIAGGDPLTVLRREHETAVDQLGVFGVPTFVVDDQAVFVRVMDRPDGDSQLARLTIQRLLDLLTGWPQLNEFKHTRVPR